MTYISALSHDDILYTRLYRAYRSWDTCNYIISATILDFWLPVSSGSVTDSAIEQFDPENMGLAVGILFLASLEAEIHLGVVLSPPNQHKCL